MKHLNNKTLAGKEISFKQKQLGLEWTKNGLGKPFRKNSNPKNWKNSKNQSEIAACEPKTTSEKANSCSNTVFSLYFKIWNSSLFRSISCFRVIKMCEQI